jgi:predicted DNA-binding protein YlxM (UPF0122 family)
MPGKRREGIQIERDRQTIMELACKGWSMQKIADYLEVSKTTVHRELGVVKQAWLDSTIEDRSLYVKQELQRLSMVESEYWAAWERSQSPQTTLTESDIAPEDAIEAQMNEAIGGSSALKLSKRTQTTAGNPQFLGGVVKVIETRSKLLGLFPDGSTAGSQLQMSDQQLQVLGELMKESKNG